MDERHFWKPIPTPGWAYGFQDCCCVPPHTTRISHLMLDWNLLTRDVLGPRSGCSHMNVLCVLRRHPSTGAAVHSPREGTRREGWGRVFFCSFRNRAPTPHRFTPGIGVEYIYIYIYIYIWRSLTSSQQYAVHSVLIRNKTCSKLLRQEYNGVGNAWSALEAMQ